MTMTMNAGNHDKNYIVLIWLFVCVVAVACGLNTVHGFLVQPVIKRKNKFAKTTFRTGDLLLWSTSFKWYTDVQKIACASRFTHVGLVFVDRQGIPFLWESTTKNGQQMTRLDNVFETYINNHATCVLRKINFPLDSVAFESFVMANIGKGYSFRLWDGVVNRWLHRMHLPQLHYGKHKQQPPPDRFCSQLVADTYQHLNVIRLELSDKNNSQLVLPSDFSVNGQAENPHALFWVTPYALGPEIKLTL